MDRRAPGVLVEDRTLGSLISRVMEVFTRTKGTHKVKIDVDATVARAREVIAHQAIVLASKRAPLIAVHVCGTSITLVPEALSTRARGACASFIIAGCSARGALRRAISSFMAGLVLGSTTVRFTPVTGQHQLLGVPS